MSKRLKRHLFYLEISIVFKSGPFCYHQEGALDFVWSFSCQAVSLCWKLTFVLSSGTPTDNRLVSFIFLSCFSVSLQHPLTPQTSIPLVWWHYSPLTQPSVPYCSIFQRLPVSRLHLRWDSDFVLLQLAHIPHTAAANRVFSQSGEQNESTHVFAFGCLLCLLSAIQLWPVCHKIFPAKTSN